MIFYENVGNDIMSAVRGFEERVNDFVKDLLIDYEPSKKGGTSSKVVNDPIWGSIYLKHHEVKLLDSPLLQRLRYISQVGLAVLTFPGTRHSRFEHSLGVFHVASEMVNNINKRAGLQKISTRESSMIRLAALLHDIGHCFYSHISERVYGEMAEFNLIKSHPVFSRKKAKPHEIFAYLIINSTAFKEFFKSLKPNIDDCDYGDTFFDAIGRMIVGYPVEEQDEHHKMLVVKNFMTDIINGGFDADKLDYIRRDAYYAGLSINYDMARLLYRIDIIEENKKTEKYKNLVIPPTGVSTIKEIAFSKISLTSAIYFHQKVLAADAIVIDFSYQMIRRELVAHPCDFLKFTEKNINKKINLDRKIETNASKTFQFFLQNIENRRLPKRALVVKTSYLEEKINNSDDKNNYKRFMKLIEGEVLENKELSDVFSKIKNKINFSLTAKDWDLTNLINTNKGNAEEHLKRMDNMRKEIYEISTQILNVLETSTIRHKFEGIQTFDRFDIFISFRDPPSFSSEDIIVRDYDDTPKLLNKLMPLNEWTSAFAANEWSGYIFSREDIIPIVNIAAREYFEKTYGIKFKEEFRSSYLKKSDVLQIHEIEKIMAEYPK